ncbi:unnamed protein product [Durusdinium trenchii]|uniref:EF-hand domain-containing protein n=1 Tax=Durusdinium trenchii TaxID=1381693 RepID=A0ABP0MRE5_9DINO
MIYKNLGALSKALSQEAFMRMATEDQVGAFLRRFSAGRLNVNFNLETWHTKAEEKKSAGVVEDVPTSLSAAAMPTSYRMDDLDQPLPRRKGYFLAVQSARESALYQELEQIRLERLKPANEVTRSNLDLELRERTIREELLGELKDDVARREYRQKKIAKPDLGLLRDLIDLFDAIDEERTGFVPIEAVEKFLSGEIVTQGENARLNLRRQARTSQRSVINAACYPTNPMDLLATALDVELHQLAQGDPNLISETIEAASNPWHHDEFVESLEHESFAFAGEQVAERVRLVRLYWRHFVSC